MQLANYVTKVGSVTAVRLNENNMPEVASLINGSFVSDRIEARGVFSVHIIAQCGVAYVGDWLVMGGPGEFGFYTDEEFLGNYHSVSEALSESDRLAKTVEIIRGAMKAARDGDAESNSWEVISTLAAKHILSTT
jgi:hypothetical protein